MLEVPTVLMMCMITGQSQTPSGLPTRRDSVTVSAGMTKEELRISEAFDEKLAAARRERDPKNAVAQLETLRAEADQHEFLHHHRPQLLVYLGQAYLAGGQAKKAVGFYEQRLAFEADECKPEASYPSACGTAQMDLGVAQIAAGQPSGLEMLKNAVANHRRQVKLDGKPEQLHHFVDLRHLSEAAMVLGVVLVRFGQISAARTSFEESRQAAAQILANPDVQASLRDEAKGFLAFIQKQEAGLDGAAR
jgi:tetratricopeptide (TPR) repeat protein